MKDLIIELFGTYTPLTDESGVVLEGINGVDFPYLLGVLTFIVLLYCLLRLLGGVLNDR